MQQRMQPPGDNKRRKLYTARELKTVWLLAQVNCDISPLLPNSCRRACGCRSCIWFSHCVDQIAIYIASFPHLTCDKGLGTTLLYIQVVLVWFFLCIWTSGCLVPRPNYRARPAACSLKGVRKTVWRCKSGARVLFLPVNYVLSWSADLGGPCLTSMTCTCCHVKLKLLRIRL